MRMTDSRAMAWVMAFLATVFVCGGAWPQDITPVDVDREKPESPRLHYYDKHGERLPEPVLFVVDADTVSRRPIASPWPLFGGIDVGVNFFDAILLAAGQSYAGFDVSARVSLHNWFFPAFEIGLGYADTHPENSNFHYKASLSPYFKIGLDYNFLYKSNPDYQVYLGLRLGVAHVDYRVADVSQTSGYWGETAHYSLSDQRSTPIYGDVLAGIKVKLWRGLSMGWSIRYHYKIHTPAASESSPWYIPGYGGSSPVGATFSLIYTFGRNKVNTSE